MKLERSWHNKLASELKKPYIAQLKRFLEEEKAAGALVYPPESQVFSAFSETPYEAVKVVIVGQDPYHGDGQAHGLSFSVPCGISPPPSLKNVFKELQADIGTPLPDNGCLSRWAKQGVMLLNATLTVRRKEPKSHYGRGWEQFTDAVISALVERDDPIVFLLWGKSAQEKCNRVKETHHKVLLAAHPSPYSAANFMGCRHFSKTNAFLEQIGKAPIIW